MIKGLQFFFISILILSGISALAQQPPPPGAPVSTAPPPPTPVPAVNPAPPQNQPVNPPPVPPPPPTPVAPIPLNNVPQIPIAPPPSGGLRPSLKDIEANVSLRNKSPFMIPTDLYVRIKRKQGERIVEGLIDNNVDPKVRWPIRNYTLVGVLSKVKNPKALISDK